MIPTDETYLREARGDPSAFTAWTCTDHGDHRTLYAFAFAPPKNKEPRGADISWEFAPGSFGVASAACAYDVTRKQGVMVPAGETYRGTLEAGQYAVATIAPIGPSGIGFLGDEDKIASTGKQRIAAIHETATSLNVTVLAASGEAVINLLGFADAAPSCSIADGKPLPVRYDAAAKMFHVAVPMPSAGGQQIVTFLRAGR